MSVIDDLLAPLPAAEKAELQRVRALIHTTVPGAKEVMTYGMPGFKYKGKYLISFGAFKDHLSLFPGAEAIQKLSSELGGYATSKGTVQFTIDHPIPDALIAAMLTMNVARIDAAGTRA